MTDRIRGQLANLCPLAPSKERVARVANHRIGGVERAPVILIQARIIPEPLWQVGVCQEESPVRYQIGVAIANGHIPSLPIVTPIHNECALERLPERQNAPRGPIPRLHHVAVEDAKLVHEADHVQWERLRVGVVVGYWGEAHAKAVRTHLVSNSADGLGGEPSMVLLVVDTVFDELVITM